MAETNPWPSEWLRGVLDLAVLCILAAGPTYGYAIAAALQQAGFGEVKGGTLYPLLTRAETAGHVVIEWRPGDGGPGRKYYHLTPAGHEELRRRSNQWLEFSQICAAHILPGAPA